jgi:hypothetical protein
MSRRQLHGWEGGWKPREGVWDGSPRRDRSTERK